VRRLLQKDTTDSIDNVISDQISIEVKSS